MAILESWCYTRRNGAASIQTESRPIPGNSRWCSAWLNSRGGGDILSYISGQPAAVVWFEVLRLYQGSVADCIYQVKSRFCLYQVTPRFCLYLVTSKILFIPGQFQDFVYARWCSSIHTSVRRSASAWAADTSLSSDCDGVCVTAFERRVSWAMTLVGAGWYLQYPQR